jgi:hypothetical protein
VTRDPQCDICNRLWKEHAQVIYSHIRIDGELRLAALQHDADAVCKLAIRLEKTVADRLSTREAIRQHEVEGHSQNATELD